MTEIHTCIAILLTENSEALQLVVLRMTQCYGDISDIVQ